MSAMPSTEFGAEQPQIGAGEGVIHTVARPKGPNALLIRSISLTIALVLWEIFGRQVDPIFMSHPSAILKAFFFLLSSGDLVKASVSSFQSLFLGYAAAAVFGIPFGLLMGRYRIFEYAVDTYVSALYSTPLVAFIPLIILWMGLGFPAKLTVVFIMTVFPVLINTYIGVRNVSGSLIEVGHAFCAGEAQIFTKIVLPATVPFIMAGLRLAIGRAIIGMVVAEFFTAITGLGAIIVNSANFFKTDRMFVPIIELMLLGVLLTQAVAWAERRIAPWKESERA